MTRHSDLRKHNIIVNRLSNAYRRGQSQVIKNMKVGKILRTSIKTCCAILAKVSLVAEGALQIVKYY